jgi:hypothetical protein
LEAYIAWVAAKARAASNLFNEWLQYSHHSPYEAEAVLRHEAKLCGMTAFQSAESLQEYI